jgi:hypothetical protein
MRQLQIRQFFRNFNLSVIGIRGFFILLTENIFFVLSDFTAMTTQQTIVNGQLLRGGDRLATVFTFQTARAIKAERRTGMAVVLNTSERIS